METTKGYYGTEWACDMKIRREARITSEEPPSILAQQNAIRKAIYECLMDYDLFKSDNPNANIVGYDHYSRFPKDENGDDLDFTVAFVAEIGVNHGN
jgi:hypothetical protein